MKIYCDNINNSSLKLAFIHTSQFFKNTNSVCKGSLVKVKKFHMNAIPAGLGLNVNSILSPIFNNIMDRTIAAGIPQYLESFSSEFFFGKYQEIEDKMPKVLTLEDLSFGFTLWLCACGMSISMFIFECLREFLALIGLLYNLIKNMPQNSHIQASYQTNLSLQLSVMPIESSSSYNPQCALKRKSRRKQSNLKLGNASENFKQTVKPTNV
ncbi:hypothetical protein ACKWTF_015166 [Chironomus riparius]